MSVMCVESRQGQWLWCRHLLQLSLKVRRYGFFHNLRTSMNELLKRVGALQESGQLVQAQNLCEELLKDYPNNVEVLNRLGTILSQSGNHALAVTFFSRALQQSPDHVSAELNLAFAFNKLGRFRLACRSFERIAKMEPFWADAHFFCGNALRKLCQLPAARTSLERAISLDAKNDKYHVCLGSVLREMSLYELAMDHYASAIGLMQDCAEAYQGRGVVQRDLLDIRGAIETFDIALSLRPDDPTIHCNKAEALLLAGEYAQGWAEYEWRRKSSNGPFSSSAASFAEPLWLGEESLAGKSILLHTEQGYGDTLQFCRYVGVVANLGARVILEVPYELESLLSNLDGVAQIIRKGTTRPAADYHASLMSLPAAFKTTLETIPATNPYIRSNVRLAEQWHNQLGTSDRPRVGLVWSGSFHPLRPESWSLRRNIPLREFMKLADLPIEFFSLQKGRPAESELEELNQRAPNKIKIKNYTHQLDNFADTAALIHQLDLVISVDTSTAHLAAAMGKPVWLLNRFDTCWRWMTQRNDSPWYPTMRIYRQRSPGNWGEVINEIRADLEHL